MTCPNKITSIYKNDDTGAFRLNGDAPFLRINRPVGLADNVNIYKAELKIGNLPIMTFENIVEEVTQPLIFPIDINLTAEQTKNLEYNNSCYLRIYDVDRLRLTCNGTISFVAKNEVV